MRYSLIKVTENEYDHSCGDSGSMSRWYTATKDDEIIKEENARPKVGGVIRVGSSFSRSYSKQDWWQTSQIEEILEETDTYCKFRTRNSIYEWKII